MLKTNLLKLKTMQYLFYQNVEYVFSHFRMDQYQKLTKTLGSLKKMQILSKKC